MTLTYTTYLKLPELLELQQVQSQPAEHDELLFIVIHQTYELWFKLMLHELEKFNRDLSAGDLYAALPTIGRCRTIMKTLVGQLDIIETMTPMSFASFRDRLETSSGFQSTQFREAEFLLGYKRRDVLRYLPDDGPGMAAVKRRLDEPSVVDHLYDFLETQGVPIPADLRERDASEPAQADERVQEHLLRLYTERPDLAMLFEGMTDFDEGLQEWRYRHVKMVERTIGSKQGTGGSPGVEFLKKSLFTPVFADLWAIRHRL
ncbi:MAG: tryptophan 2,3-dioxygenase [Planctomycetes bacterium]|nr:tryptophan 2,3-dioxygenase [Planctomycetota bacterium]